MAPAGGSFAAAEGHWLAASSQGVWHGRPGGDWQPFGALDDTVNRVCRDGAAVVAGGDGGLWLARPGADRWRQVHDETLTMVQDVARLAGDGQGWLVASGYGVHRAARDGHGAWRWHNHREDLADPSARFTLRLLGLDVDGRRWLAGTEAGLWLSGDGGASWRITELDGVAVRAVTRGTAGVWAGTDTGALWHSADGCTWRAADGGPGAPVLALMEDAEGHLWAGTPRGLWVRDAAGAWSPTGPPVAVVCVAASGGWLALGASPGGLWWSADGGDRWHSTPALTVSVRHLETP